MKIGQEQQILVEVGEYEFCIDLDEVLSIINPPKMVRLPSARGAFIRAFKYQDELGAAVSMRVKFALPEREDMQSGQILLGRLHDHLAGFWFDKVTQILKVGDGAQWYPIPTNVSLPSTEFDSFIRYRERLIPHTSLMGLLRFEQAEAWKHFIETEKPRLEAKMLAAEQQQAEAAAREAGSAKPQFEASEALISMEEFYALMDEAGVAEELEAPSAEPEAVAVEQPQEPVDKALSSDSMETEEAPSPPLAVPVNPPETAEELPEPSYPLTVGESAEEEVLEPAPETAAASEAVGEDAMFSLERKREDIRKRMNPEGDANLGDYSIIKVGDSSLFRWLGRWLKRLLLLVILSAIAYTAIQGVRYQEQQKLSLEQLWIHTPEGETDWNATRQAVHRELQSFGRFLKQSLKVN